MEFQTIGPNSRVKELYHHPVGKDVVDKVLFQLNKSERWIQNPIIGNIKLSTLAKILKPWIDDYFWQQLFWLLSVEKERPLKLEGPIEWKWWKEAVFYQVYPRSFMDSNGDGIGDLAGIISRLDYLKDLGVDAIWLSPIYDSPNDDMGYDIRNYQEILAEMGTMADFDELLDQIHQRDMKLIMDLVVNHTSDEHEWFQKALDDPEGPYGQYYFIQKGTEGQLPNNWESFFSGSAWRWFPEIESYVLKLFSDKQVDLNWDHPPVRQDIYQMIRWWLEKGVDGFRLDVINYISKRPGLPDGSEFVGELVHFTGIENYFYGPNLHTYMQEMRREVFEPYQAFSVAETPGVGIEMGLMLTGEERQEFDLIFNFDHLETPGHIRYDIYDYDLNYLKKFYIKYQRSLASNHWISIFLDNHDNARMLSKVNKSPKYRKVLGKMLMTLQLTMRGTPFIYQGQELAMTNQNFKNINDLRDVESINLYKSLEGQMGKEDLWLKILSGARDHSRVPMIWDSSQAYNGFSTSEPWIVGNPSRPGWSAQEQMDDPESVYSYTQFLLTLRKNQQALRRGDIRFVKEDQADYFAYYREYEDSKLFIEMNLSDQVLEREVENRFFVKAWSNYQSEALHKVNGHLLPYEAIIYLIK